MTIEHTTQGSIFDDLGFSPEEANNLKIRASLMRSLTKYIQDRGLKQYEAAEIFNVDQPRVSDLIRGKINKFSIDQLIIMHEKAHMRVALIIDDRLVA